MTKNAARLICKSIFDITITFSDIPYKCSHVVEIENLKIFDFNYFCKSYSKLQLIFLFSPVTVTVPWPSRDRTVTILWLFVLYRPPFMGQRPSPSTVYRSPSTVHRPPSTVHRPPFTVHRPPSTVHRSPFTVHRSPFTVHRSPFFLNIFLNSCC